MPRWIARFLFILASVPFLLQPLEAAETIAQKTEGMEARDGFFRFYWDHGEGRIWLEIERLEEEFLYVTGMASGLGSNDVGLDRTQLRANRVVFFRRIGPKVLLIQPNLDYRAGPEADPLEAKSVRDAFAESVLWGFPIEAEEGGKALIDLTEFLLHDAVGLPERLEEMEEGKYRLDPSRSAIFLPRTRAFPDNCEFEASLTFQGENPGREVRSVTPTPELVTVRQHHSFIRLPDGAYEPREFHVGSGYFPLSYQDYTVPIGEDLTQRVIRRHRLRKVDPDAEVSDPVEPIIYYLDPGTPEPVRSALIEGGSWWNQAFAAIGYRNAFRIEMLPEDADPMDVRYNVINWLHRSTRGWSYGSSIFDPRTGEILKGHVNLGSLRVRQDFLIAEGLLAPYTAEGAGDERMLQLALARIRQLSAHEIGHTLGLTHNFAASSNERASVMDYPHPLIRQKEDGTLDLEHAYATGIGKWDKVAIAYGYQDFSPGADERAELLELLRAAYQEEGLRFIADADARPPGGLHPLAHLWDNGDDPVDELGRLLRIRRRSLERLAPGAIRNGSPLATLEEPLIPIYFLHRYQAEAVARLVGGIHYRYSLRESNPDPTRPVASSLQAAALESLLGTLRPEALELPAAVIELIPPRPPGYPSHRELSRRHTGLAFDPLALAEAWSNHVASLLLNPQRAARLIQQKAYYPESPGLAKVMDGLIEKGWGEAPAGGVQAELKRTVGYAVLQHLLGLATNRSAAPQVRAVAHTRLLELQEDLQALGGDPAQQAANRYAVLLIENYRSNPEQPVRPDLLEAPPGSPIGCGF